MTTSALMNLIIQSSEDLYFLKDMYIQYFISYAKQFGNSW